MSVMIRTACTLAIMLCGTGLAQADNDVTLTKEFIETYKDRVVIELKNFQVDASHRKAKTANQDGDIHAAGHSDQVGLAMVAEIMNAKNQPQGIKMILESLDENKPIPVTGVWRIWCEHGNSEFV